MEQTLEKTKQRSSPDLGVQAKVRPGLTLGPSILHPDIAVESFAVPFLSFLELMIVDACI